VQKSRDFWRDVQAIWHDHVAVRFAQRTLRSGEMPWNTRYLYINDHFAQIVHPVFVTQAIELGTPL
jgi:hypothetical protein